ncbi:hAT-like transposase, RNase-H fold [Sesbania bispinosa]|nr:hAT-like transposase, RNase-H fold [Sesbania bispinosa]
MALSECEAATPMANQGEFLASETAEHIVSTPPAVSNTGTMLPPRSVGRRNRSEAWNHFTIEPGLEKKAKFLGIGKKIRQMINNRDGSISSMGQKMKTKYEKYWGNPDKLNMLLLIALVLDPRYKMKFINWLINLNFDSDDASNLRNNVEACLTSLVEEYNGGILDFEADSQEARLNEEGVDDPFELNQFYDTDGCDKTKLALLANEDFETLENLEQEMNPPQDVQSTSIALDDD